MKKNAKLAGVYAAIVTPFIPDESIDFEALKKLIDYLAEGEVTGILIGGNTGEFPLLEKAERKELFIKAVEYAANRLKIVACCSMNTTKATMEMVKYANMVGVDYVILALPYDMPTDFENIYEFFKEAADLSEVGVCIYHYPSYTGVHLTPAQMAELAAIDNVVGTKNVVDVDELMELLYLNRVRKNDTFGVLCAWDRQFVPAMAGGCDGIMGVAPTVVPKKCMQIYHAMQADNVAAARAISQTLEPVYDAIFNKVPFPGGIKLALEALGLPCGNPRKPLAAANRNSLEDIKRVFAHLD